MTIDVLQAAKFLSRESGWKYSNLELHKIIYITHMMILGSTHQPLVSEYAEAWDYGPVYVKLYHHLKEHGKKSIPKSAFKGIKDLGEKDYEKQFATLNKVATLFPHSSSSKLIAFTHQKISAWSEKYEPGAERAIITHNDVMKEYERRLARQQERKGRIKK